MNFVLSRLDRRKRAAEKNSEARLVSGVEVFWVLLKSVISIRLVGVSSLLDSETERDRLEGGMRWRPL